MADDGGQRQAGGKAFGDDHQIGLDGEILEGKHLRGAAEAGLNFVEDQDHAVVGGYATEFLKKAQGGRDEAALADCGSTTMAATRSGSRRVANRMANSSSERSAVQPRYS